MIAATRRPDALLVVDPSNRALLGQEAADAVDVDAAVLVAVDEDREGANVAHRVDRSDERHGRHDDLVARPHAGEDQRDVKRRCPAVAGDGVSHADVVGQSALEPPMYSPFDETHPLRRQSVTYSSSRPCKDGFD